MTVRVRMREIMTTMMSKKNKKQADADGDDRNDDDLVAGVCWQ